MCKCHYAPLGCRALGLPGPRMARHMQAVTQSAAVGLPAQHSGYLCVCPGAHQDSLHAVRLAPAHLVSLKVPALDLLVQGATEEVGHPIMHSQPSDLQQQGLAKCCTLVLTHAECSNLSQVKAAHGLTINTKRATLVLVEYMPKLSHDLVIGI